MTETKRPLHLGVNEMYVGFKTNSSRNARGFAKTNDTTALQQGGDTSSSSHLIALSVLT